MATETELNILIKAKDLMSATVVGVQRRLDGFRRSAEVISKRLRFDALGASLTRVGRSAANLTSAVGRVTRRLTLMGAVGVGAVVAMTTSFAASADQIAKTADKLGIGIEQLQELRFAGERAGISIQTTDLAIQRFVRRTAEAANGSGEAVDALNELGLSSETLARVSPDQALRAVADAMQKIPNQADRVRIAFKLFDSEGVAFVNVLADGSAGLDEAAARLRTLGGLLGEDAVRAAERFSNELLEAKTSLGGVRAIIGAELMPIFGQWLTQLTTLVTERGPQIQAWAREFAAGLPGRIEALKGQFADLVDRLRPVIDFGQRLVEKFGGATVAAGALGLMLGAPLIVPVVTTTVALGLFALALINTGARALFFAGKGIPAVIKGLKLLAAAAASNPITATIIGIAALAGILIANWDTVGPWFANLWAGLKTTAAGFWSWFVDLIGFDPLPPLRAVWGVLVDWFTGTFGVIKRVITGDFTDIKNLFNFSPLGLLQSGFGKALEYLQGIDWSGAGKALIETLLSGLRSVIDKPVALVRDALAKVRNLLPFSDAKEGPLSRLTASGQAIPDTLAKGVERGRPALVDTVRAVTGQVSRAIDDRMMIQPPVISAPAVAKAASLAQAEKPATQPANSMVLSLGTAISALVDTVRAVTGQVSRAIDDRMMIQPPVISAPAVAKAASLAQAEKPATQPANSMVLSLGTAISALVDTVRAVTGQVSRAIDGPASSAVAGSARPSGAPATAMIAASGSRPPGGRAIHVARVDFRPNITIQAGPNASPQNLADLLADRLAEFRDAGLWSQIQGVQELA
ncbi:MAG: hypothetical protein RQ757_06940 [Pseudomonadales bacterium]|nr:hypothetical protein [Pseudomonadales bacterium]